jgi:hypothetical protein
MNVTSETDIDSEWMELLDSSSTVNLDLSVHTPSRASERIILAKNAVCERRKDYLNPMKFAPLRSGACEVRETFFPRRGGGGDPGAAREETKSNPPSSSYLAPTSSKES